MFFFGLGTASVFIVVHCFLLVIRTVYELADEMNAQIESWLRASACEMPSSPSTRNPAKNPRRSSVQRGCSAWSLFQGVKSQFGPA